MNHVTIQGDPRYIDFHFQPFTFPMLAACIPIIYLVPTIILNFKIVLVYCRMTNRKELINPNILLVIILSQISSFGYTLSDYIIFRIPSTGIITSWCASREPSHLFKFVGLFPIYCTFSVMIYPFVLSILRLIPVYFPVRQSQISAKVVRYSIPAVLLYPFLFSFPIFPALGHCKQIQEPYSFGSVYISLSETLFDMVYFVFPNTIFWLLACVVNYLILYIKLKKLGSQSKSLKLQRAELSVTLTFFSMLTTYTTNLILMILYLINPSLPSYFAAIRPFGNDFDTVLVPWIFYLTHPAFKRKPKNKANVEPAS